VIVVDTHCHASPAWYLPVESLLAEMDRYGVQHAVLVQMREQYNNEYQFECVRRYPGRFASVVIVDHTRPDAVQQLERLAAEGASGARLAADTRSPGDDPLALWRAAERLGLAVSCQPSGDALATDEFAGLVEALPRLPIVLEHLAGQHRVTARGQTAERAGDGWRGDTTLEKVLALVRFPNVSVKIPGLGEFCERAMPVTEQFPFVQPIPPLLEMFYDAFGSSRLMWGSDFPPVAMREGYGNALRLPMEQFADKSEEDRAAIFGGTALSVFKLTG
jgi:L-fuconolactonase